MKKIILNKGQSARMTRETKRAINDLYLQSISRSFNSSALKREMTRKGLISYES